MMDSFELNKLIGAFLAVVFVVFSVSIVSNSIFATHAPENPGYIIEAAEEGASGGGQAAEEGPSIAELLQTADPAAGENAFKKCAACHTTEEGGANKVGPNLWNIINRPVASHEGFNYSAGMREFSQGGSVAWDYDHISEFLKSPRNYVPGTAMAFAGLRNPQEEANLIAYLRNLSDSPAPLPEDAAAPAGEEATAPAEGENAAPAETDEAAPAEDNAQPAEEAAPQPDTTDDGSSASPETDAGEGTGSEAQPEETAPADQ